MQDLQLYAFADVFRRNWARSIRLCMGYLRLYAFADVSVRKVDAAVRDRLLGDCSRGKRNQFYLRDGLEAMLSYLKPQVVLVYGAMPHYVFDGLGPCAEFINYPDWTTRMRRG